MTWRYKISLIFLFFFFFAIILRLFYWQIVKSDELSALGQSQYGAIKKLLPQRGEILTSDGFPLVTNKITYRVFANPKEVSKKEKTAITLAPLLEDSVASISSELSQNLFWVSLATGIDPKKKEEIESLKLPGIGFEQEYSRFYPEASIAATLTGFVGKDEAGEDKGYFGLEGYYDRLLRGREGNAIQINDALGRPILARTEGLATTKDGSSLILNIDRSVQFLIERKLKDAVVRYGASGGMIVVMEPSTGKIIAMASSPSYDPRDYLSYSADLYKNPIISDLYEPGSTFKPLVMSSAFNENLLTPQSKCPICAGPVPVSGYLIHTWNDKYFKDSTMTDVIQHSDNTGMVYVAQKLGLSRMLSYFDKFGIGNLTGIDLQGEVAPEIKPKNDWYGVDLATAGFGQGISVTPIELITAFSSIANSGKIMEPQVVGSIKSPEGKITKIEPKQIGTPISETSAKVMTEILVNAVNKGEASYARLKNYRIAGKTGTASIPIEGHYDSNQTIASFIGFAPADKPKYVMLVIFNRPTAAIYGAETAAPVFFDISKSLLNYYGIPPTE